VTETPADQLHPTDHATVGSSDFNGAFRVSQWVSGSFGPRG
jgi:hypothetical protein